MLQMAYDDSIWVAANNNDGAGIEMFKGQDQYHTVRVNATIH